jgi:hypothetical protein
MSVVAQAFVKTKLSYEAKGFAVTVAPTPKSSPEEGGGWVLLEPGTITAGLAAPSAAPSETHPNPT